jgi:cytochrome c-type biogenesis protein CcmH/NrfG
MTGLLLALVLALVVLLALKLAARLAIRDMAAPAMALLLGLAGYAWLGHPGLAGHPVTAKAAIRFDERLAEKRRAIGERVGPASKWLVMSDGLARAGATQDAANVIVSGLKETPDDANLWVGLGNALLAHGGGSLSPAANHAYRRALALEPDGVSPNYFYGLALAQSGQFEAAQSIWRALAARLPENADLRAELERNVGLLDRLIAERDGTGRATPEP